MVCEYLSADNCCQITEKKPIPLELIGSCYYEKPDKYCQEHPNYQGPSKPHEHV